MLSLKILTVGALLVFVSVTTLHAADVIINGDFNGNINNWTPAFTGTGSVQYDGTAGASGASPGSGQIITDLGINQAVTGYLSQSLGTINASDSVTLSLHWYKESGPNGATYNNIAVRIVRPSGDSVDVWTNTTIPSADSSLSGDVVDFTISGDFNQTGVYTIRLVGDLMGENNISGFAQANFDDVILDVTEAANQPPVVTDIPDQTIAEGTSFVTITLDDYVSDVDNTDAEMTWTYSGNTELVVDITNRVATITTPNADWNGVETITFRATDPGTLWDEDPATFTVTAQNDAPTVAVSATTVSPASLDRVGATTTTLSVTFTDADDPGPGAFSVTFILQRPYSQGFLTIADNLQNGQSGMTVTAGGNTSYTASIDWDPPDDAAVGYYDLYCEVSDGFATTIDNYDDNLDELLVTNGGENASPIVASDAAFASPAGVERIGANLTTLSATFTDGDAPAVSVFRVSFKLREPDNSTEVILTDNAADGQSGLSISNLGGGVYTAAVDWDPGDAATLGYWDIYFHVTDGTADTAFDGYQNNLDEMELYDAISNNPPTIVADTTFALPISVNRIGSEFTMLKSVFTDIDIPGKGAFTISFKVRDAGSGEVIVVNAAKHGEQGLRVVHQGGGTYEASVLWDPDVADVTGLYDLQFEVTDDQAASATDNYTVNSDELTVTSSAVLGDGNLLHRSNTADGCGGPNSACHNMVDHQSQDCRVCHTPHGTSNIYLVRDTIQTPNSGPRAVDFRTLGIGDPYNDPDPTPGVWAGAMADDADGIHTGVCEVCHTTVSHHTNDDTHSLQGHNNAQICSDCHMHVDGFSGGGESGGGVACICHNQILASMDSSSVAYRHILADDAADYSPGVDNMYTIKNCLSCHVDHDIFRPDINTGIGQRGRNLRTDWAIDPVLGDASVLSNSDYSSTGSGGICLSCHSGPGCDGCHSAHKAPPRDIHGAAASDFTHTFIPKTDFDAATSAHNYDVPSTFTSDGSTFNANCSKCHNDNMSKSYQNSTYKFSTHGSDFNNILDSTGITGGTDPLEEEFCFKCHSTTSNPNAGSNLDFYGVKSMTNQDALDIEAAFSRTYTHPTLTYSGRHSLADSVQSLADGNRHAECEDCHNPHAAQQGTHDGSTSLASNALKGTWGVEPTSWPTPTVPSDNANVFTAPASYTRVEGATLEEWMICLKCHSNYTTLPSGARNLAAEINPNYPSTHGITIANQNSYCNTTTMLEPWASSGLTYCSDCHRSDNAADPEGPHGSNAEHLLVATIVSDNSVGTPLCYTCHSESVYWSGSASASRYDQHPSNRGAHKRSKGCFACHMWDYADIAGLGVQTSEVFTDGEVFVHGQNKYWNFQDDNGNAGTGDPSDSFCNGYLADMDYSVPSCWSDGNSSGCGRGHNDTSY